ncbi:MAG: SRPBCC family protein [Actinomycetota bacterium]
MADPKLLSIGPGAAGGYRLTTSLLLERPLGEVFEFFSNAHNLTRITPSWLGLKVVTAAPVDMHDGTLFDYRFRVNGVPGRWRSMILEWNPPHSFVDRQVSGPFALWVHRHTFESAGGGTIAGDDISYRVPGGPPVHELVVRRNLTRLFAYRHEAMQRLFG